jgi:hypothetical protein
VPGELVGHPDVVLVGERHEVTARDVRVAKQAGEVRRGRAARGQGRQHRDARVGRGAGCEQVGRGVGRRVVGHDHADVDVVLAEDRVELLVEPGGAVVGGEQNRDARSGHASAERAASS